MATHSSILAWRIPWTEEPGELQSIGSQRVRHDLATEQQQLFASVFLSVKLECLRTARRSNQSILKEISPECSLEGQMMKLKLQYFGHFM